MAKCASLDTYPFGGIGDTHADDLFSKDYPYKNFETYKFKAVTTNGASVDYKANFNILKKSEAFSGEGGDELKITFPVSGQNMIARLLTNRKGDLEANLDFKEKEIKGRNINFFTNFKTQFDFSSIVIRAGANYFGKKFNTQSHIETDLAKCSFFKKITGKENECVYGLATTLGTDLKPSQFDAYLGYEKSDFDVYLKHSTDKSTNSFAPQTLALQGVYRNNDLQVGFNATKDVRKEAPLENVEVGLAKKVDDKLNVKAKFNKAMNLGLSAKYKHNASYTFTFGANVPVAALQSGTSSGKLLPVDLGLQVELNV